MRHFSSPKQAFSLPTVLLISITVLGLCLAALQTTSFVRGDIQTYYYQQLAKEAAEAGLVHATSCLDGPIHAQTWTGSLTPATDCTGTTISGQSAFVYKTTAISTAYTVGDLDVGTTNGVQISSTGTSNVIVGGTTIKSYTATMKKVITWNPNIVSQVVTSGYTRSCAVVTNNAYCWGSNTYGALGNGTTDDSLTPVAVERDPYPAGIGAHKVITISASYGGACVVIDTGEVYCWGYNLFGQIGDGTTTNELVPTKVTGLTGKNIVKLGSSTYTMCALSDVGDLFCWGRGYEGQVGNGAYGVYNQTPVQIGGSAGGFGGLQNKVVSDISPNGPFFGYFFCAIATGQAYCWGDNNSGEIGTNATTAKYNVPTAVYTGGVLSGKTVIDIATDGQSTNGGGVPGTYDTSSTLGSNAVGSSAACATAYTSAPADAKAYCWGSNLYGQLGNGGTMGTSSNNYPAWIYRMPVAVSTSGVLSGKIVTQIAVSDGNGCALAYSGSVTTTRAYCWGEYYARGDQAGGANSTNIPVTVTDTTTPSVFANNQVSGLTGGAHRMCAIVQGLIYCWGKNSQGQIGDGTTVDRFQPTQALFLNPLNSQYIF